MAAQGVARSGKAWQGNETTIVQERRPIDAAVVGCGVARRGVAWLGRAGHGKAR